MIEIKTDDTYEASWYILMGGRLVGIAFGKIQPNRASKLGYTTAYKLTIGNVHPKFVRYWRDGNPIGNIRAFSGVRHKLKMKIKKAERQQRRNE